MFYYITSIQRSLKTTKLYSTSSPGAIAERDALSATLPASPTYLGSHTYTDVSGLKFIYIQKWDSQASYDSWIASHGTAYAAARAAYNAANAIVYSVLPVTTDAVLF